MEFPYNLRPFGLNSSFYPSVSTRDFLWLPGPESLFVLHRDLHLWLKWHVAEIRSGEQSLHVHTVACQPRITRISLLSGGPSVS